MNVLIEEKQRLSHSILWRLQRNYFERQGIAAWSTGAVPHHITSSPFIADAYARVITGFLRECTRVGIHNHESRFASAERDPTFYVVELGSGSGRFAYLFLKKFVSLYRKFVFRNITLKYVMTDFSERNLEFWRSHRWLQPFVDEGLLDFARCDVERDEELRLTESGKVLSPATLHQPLVLIANYLFDSIPQDAFLINEGQLFETVVTVSRPPESDLDDPDILSRIEISYDHNRVDKNYYEDPEWNNILLDYTQRLANAAFIFPTAALHVIRNFHRLANGRMLLLSGDRGYHSDEGLCHGQGAPVMAVHGSFSMMVDYQILGHFCRCLGGQVLHSGRRSESLNISAFVFSDWPGDLAETRQSYIEAIQEFGPDDFFTLKSGVDQLYGSLTLEEILAFLKLSGWDHKRFRQSLPALKGHLTNISDIQREELARAVHRVWDSYLPIGEENDLAFELGTLLLELEFYSDALEMLGQSVDLYGIAAGTAYNMAVSYFRLGLIERALEYVNEAMLLDPDFEAAKELRAELV